MALILSPRTETPQGDAAEYAMVAEAFPSRIDDTSVATVLLYKSEVDKKTLLHKPYGSISWKFIFTLDEIREVEPDENIPTDIVEAWFHCHYLRIRELANEAHALRAKNSQCELTHNQEMALLFHDAQDDLT